MTTLVFDIESYLHPVFRSSQYPAGDKDHPEWATWTDEQCVADYQSKQGKGADAFVPYSFHRPVSIGYILADDVTLELMKFGVLDELTTKSYREMISTFWTLVNGPPPAPKAPGVYASVEESMASGWARPTLVHFNGRGYDIPVLEHAAFELGLWMGEWHTHIGDPYRRHRNRYCAENFDLQEVFNNFSGKGPAGGLDRMAKSIGLPGKMGINGAEVWPAYRAGRIKDISTYCMCDVADTYFLYVRQMVVEGVIPLERERELRQSFKLGFAGTRLDEYCSKLQVPDAQALTVTGIR